MRVNSSRGNSRASSHSGACGRISFSTNERSDSRSASCSSVKGGISRCVAVAHARTRSAASGPGAVALAHLVPALERRVAAARVVEAEQVALAVLRRPSGGRRAPRRSARPRSGTTRCRGRCRCSLPWRGSRQSIVHSITTSSPCSIPCSRCQLASRCLTPCSVISPICLRAACAARGACSSGSRRAGSGARPSRGRRCSGRGSRRARARAGVRSFIVRG